MRNRILQNVTKPVLFMLSLFAAVILFNAVQAKAYDPTVDFELGKAVRVSTQKELNDAIANSDADTIIFRTQAEISVTIKPNENAKNKNLVIDSLAAKVTNKANFKAVVIYNAWYYTEKASGNTICFFNNSEASNFIVAKGKTVNELTLFNTNNKLFFNYILRKGASINNIVYMIYSDGVANVSTYESKTRTVTINDPDGTACAYVKLDKKGRVKSIKGIEWIGDTETEYDFKYSYDKNGNSTGIYISKDSYARDQLFEYDSKGHTVKVLTHEINDGVEFNTLKSNSYDEKGRLIKSAYTNENDGTEIGSVTYEYNKKGKCIRQYQAYPDGSWYEVTRTYNSKGFRTSQTDKTSSGDISKEVFKYNKAGDLLKDINTLTDGSVYTYMYSYNENGKYLKTEVIGPDGERKEL
jgi:hypothetical protein